MQETWVQSLGRKDPLEKEMATHCISLAWRIPWTEEPGGLQSMGSQRVGCDFHALAFGVKRKLLCTSCCWGHPPLRENLLQGLNTF